MNPPGATQTTEWSNPRPRLPLGFETTLGSNLSLVLKSADTFFGAQGQPLSFEPPNNPQLARRDITLTTHLQDTKLNLISLDRMFAGAGQVPQYDWQLPILTKFPLDLRGFTQELKQNLLSQDTMLGLPGVPLETVQFLVVNTPSYFYYGIGLLITEPSLVLPSVTVITVTTKFINEFDLGNATINRALELFRKF